jgi:short subunit dehydrogenase-like uncharacterized protein
MDDANGRSMSNSLMIYGATGYTGRLIAGRAVELGLRPILGGRDPAKLAGLAAALHLEHRVVHLADPDALDRALAGISVVLHAAGPFAETSGPMVEACMRTRTHYLDISGEVPAIEGLAARGPAARERGIMVMPGVGFDVVPSDCLAARVARRLPGATRLALGISGLALATRGSVKTLVRYAGGVAVRRDGRITAVTPGTLERHFDYGNGPRSSVNVTWGDVATAYYTTAIPNVEVYFESTPALRGVLAANRLFAPLLQSSSAQAWMRASADLLPEGPTADERRLTTTIVAHADDGRGGRATSRLRAPEAYTLTAATAPVIARRVLAGDLERGFQTPARVYGPEFVRSFAHVTVEDLD